MDGKWCNTRIARGGFRVVLGSLRKCHTIRPCCAWCNWSRLSLCQNRPIHKNCYVWRGSERLECIIRFILAGTANCLGRHVCLDKQTVNVLLLMEARAATLFLDPKWIGAKRCPTGPWWDDGCVCDEVLISVVGAPVYARQVFVSDCLVGLEVDNIYPIYYGVNHDSDWPGHIDRAAWPVVTSFVVSWVVTWVCSRLMPCLATPR